MYELLTGPPAFSGTIVNGSLIQIIVQTNPKRTRNAYKALKMGIKEAN
jgi:hypothetical protein